MPGCAVNGTGFYNPTNVNDPPASNGLLDFQSERLGGDYDVEWRTRTGHTFRNVINYGVEMPVTRTYPHTSLVPGTSVVCKMGFTTGYNCGTVTSISEQVTWFGSVGTYVRVKNNAAGAMAAGGDSGGPVFGQNTAYGLVTYVWESGSTPGEMGFMPISRISVLGLSILTQ